MRKSSQKGGGLRDYAEETAAVSLGRLIGFHRLVDIDDQVEDQLDTTISTQAPAEDDVRSGDSGG